MVHHHFLEHGEIYAKEIRIKKDQYIMQHVHTYDHFGILTRGSVVVVVDGKGTVVYPGAPYPILRGQEHYIRALEDSVWLCVHHTTEKDADHVDQTLIGD